MGLVEGYELMKLTLSQPQLRAGLEVDLKAICEGKKNSAEVLRRQLDIYKQCYDVIIRDISLLDRAVGNRFGSNPQAEAGTAPIFAASVHELFKCPKCRNSSIIVRQKKDNSGSFLSCQAYPACKHAIWLQNSIKNIASLDEKCTSCGGENHKVKIKFAQPHMFSMVDEVAAYSRIEDGFYITCLYCDRNVRDVLHIKTDDVKIIGNVVGVASHSIHQPQVFNSNNNNQHNNNNNISNNNRLGNSGQTRNFGTNSSSNDDNNHQRRNWFNTGNNNDDGDDNRPSGGGGAIANNSRLNDSAKGYQVLNNLPNVFCQCKLIAKKLLCRKEGPNKDRPFYNCTNRQCQFFAWADVALPSNVQIAPSSANSSSGSNGGVTGRRCSVCKNLGHNKRNCPNVQH